MGETGYQLANTILAGYAAVLATISIIASIILGYLEVRRHRPRVKVTAKYGVLSDAQRGNSEPLIFLEAVNNGSGSIAISGVGWLLKGGRKIMYTAPPLMSLPHVLLERRKCTTNIPCRSYNNDEDRGSYRRPFFQDETGEVWKGRITRSERRLWANAPNTGYKVY